LNDFRHIHAAKATVKAPKKNLIPGGVPRKRPETRLAETGIRYDADVTRTKSPLRIDNSKKRYAAIVHKAIAITRAIFPGEKWDTSPDVDLNTSKIIPVMIMKR
jgi:hypothetical protein